MNLPARNPDPDHETVPARRAPRTYAIQRPSVSASLGERRLPSSTYDEEAPVFELANLWIAAGFPWRAIKRHRRLATMMFAGLLSLVGVAIAVTPRHYMIETKFFAEKNFVMPALGNPKRAVPTESDSPTRLAAEAVMKRANLLEIMRQTQLMDSWDELRSPLGKVRDVVVEAVKGPLLEEDRLEAMLGFLEKRIWVETDDGTVTIGLDWPNAAIGYRIVQTAQQNFFEQRHASELSLIGESVGILEGHVASSQRAIQEALAQINAALPKRVAPKTDEPEALSARPSAPSAAVLTVQSELRTVQQTLADLTASRSQRLVAAQGRLQELRASYGSAHPDVTAAEENIRAIEAPSPQIAQLRAREAAVLSRLTALGGRASQSAASLEPSFARAALERLTRTSVDSQEAPEVTFARSRLKIATSAYEDLLDRLEGARIELETARAAFKYRYSVIKPARIPKEPKKPTVALLLVGGVILAVLATLFTVVMLDFGGGRVLEPWQVDRQLGLPVLADVKRR